MKGLKYPIDIKKIGLIKIRFSVENIKSFLKMIYSRVCCCISKMAYIC